MIWMLLGHTTRFILPWHTICLCVWQDNTALFYDKTKQPCCMSGQNSLVLWQDKMALLYDRAKQPCSMSGQSSLIECQDKRALYVRAKQLYMSEQNSIIYQGKTTFYVRQNSLVLWQELIRAKQPCCMLVQNSLIVCQVKIPCMSGQNSLIVCQAKTNLSVRAKQSCCMSG